MPLAMFLVFAGAVIIFMGIDNVSFAGVINNDPSQKITDHHAPTPAGAGAPAGPAPGGGIAPPGGLRGLIPKGEKFTLNRIDQGRDIQLRPGAALLAQGNGVVTAVPSDPKGFGPAYPVIRYSDGPLSGHEIYYGHVDSAVHVGDHVHPGSVVAHTAPHGHNSPPGWLEIGTWPPKGMGAGSVMNALLGIK